MKKRGFYFPKTFFVNGFGFLIGELINVGVMTGFAALQEMLTVKTDCIQAKYKGYKSDTNVRVVLHHTDRFSQRMQESC